uniref:Uncharacterized protein n=1 Tax=Aegilops tauschii subsp. strangulata TaxID=200361 RepID=A0A453JNH0_AEGTS
MYGSCNLHIHNSEAIELQSAHNPHRVVHLSVPFRGTHLVDSGEEENFSGTSDFVAGRKALLEISELRCGFEQFCQVLLICIVQSQFWGQSFLVL